MKKKILLLMVCLLFMVPCFGFDFGRVEKVIDLDEQQNEVASKILYDFILHIRKWTPEVAEKDFGYISDLTVATYYDLNNDGEDEIIGISGDVASICSQGEKLYILQNKNGIYKSIITDEYICPHRVSILSTKTNGYCDIKISMRVRNTLFNRSGVKKTKLKFNGKIYYNTLICRYMGKKKCEKYIEYSYNDNERS